MKENTHIFIVPVAFIRIPRTNNLKCIYVYTKNVSSHKMSQISVTTVIFHTQADTTRTTPPFSTSIKLCAINAANYNFDVLFINKHLL